MKTIYLFRHGETDWNRAGRFQGGTDIPLNETGREQARGLISFFARNPVDVILSSDLKRAVETSRIALDGRDIEIVLDPRMRETNLGQAEGLTGEEIDARFGGEVLNAWRSSAIHDQHVRFPGGESKAEHLARLVEGLTEFVLTTSHARIAVASHGGAMRRLIHHFLPNLEEPARVANCTVYRLTFDPKSGVWLLDPTPLARDEER